MSDTKGMRAKNKANKPDTKTRMKKRVRKLVNRGNFFAPSPQKRPKSKYAPNTQDGSSISLYIFKINLHNEVQNKFQLYDTMHMYFYRDVDI